MPTTLLLLIAMLPPTEDPAAAGTRVLLEAATALQGPFRDAVVVETTARGAPARVAFTVTYGADGLGKLERGPVTAVLEDDWASVTHAARPDSYFVAEASGAAIEDLLQLFSPACALFPYVALRAVEEEYEVADAFATSWEDEVRVTYHRIERRGGREVDVVTLAHVGGKETIVLDAATHHVVRRSATRDGVKWSVTHDIEPLEDLSIGAFDPGDRELTGELLALLRAAPGDDAAPFVAPRRGGEVALDALRRDRVVILDLWATWCAPCRKGLKELEKFAAEVDDAEVAIVAVNVAERLEKEDRIEAVEAFWKKSGYRFPTIYDFDDTIRRSYGAAEIPLTMIIGKDGRIHAVHPEKTPLLEWLRRETATATE